MKLNRTLVILLALVLTAVALVILVSTAFAPDESDPAFGAAVRFINAAAGGDEETALALLSPALQDYVRANCPDAQVTGCVRGYIPAEWGAFQSATFRRAAPDGAAWDVDVIGYYAQGTGGSGVCFYTRMEQDAAGAWLVQAWAGFVSCGDAESRDMADNADAPNRVP